MDPQGFIQPTFSQCGEDLVLNLYLFSATPNGYYVDVGAHHPYRLSNTALFHQRGWRGINIDVGQRAIDAFNEVRPDDTNILCGVAGQRGTLNLHLFGEGAVNTLSDSLATCSQQFPGREVIEVRPVEVFPLSSLLDEHLPEGQASTC